MTPRLADTEIVQISTPAELTADAQIIGPDRSEWPDTLDTDQTPPHCDHGTSTHYDTGPASTERGASVLQRRVLELIPGRDAGNWQSEFLQLAGFVIIAAYLIHRDSPTARRVARPSSMRRKTYYEVVRVLDGNSPAPGRCQSATF